MDTYSLTFTTYGSPPEDGRNPPARLSAPLLGLDGPMRDAVADCIVEVCGWNGWSLDIVNVLPGEVHVVVSAERTPEYVMTELKGWATRRLRETGLVEGTRPIWNRNGSIRYVLAGDELAGIVADVGAARGDDTVGVRFGRQDV